MCSSCLRIKTGHNLGTLGPLLQARPQPPAAWRCSWRQCAEMYLSSQQTQRTTSATPSARSLRSTPLWLRASPTSMLWCVLQTSQRLQQCMMPQHQDCSRLADSSPDNVALLRPLRESVSCQGSPPASAKLPIQAVLAFASVNLKLSGMAACPPALFSVSMCVPLQLEGHMCATCWSIAAFAALK